MKRFIKCPRCGKVQIAEEYGQHFCTECIGWIFPDEIEALPAISIQQPWAWAIVAGFKDIENRNWKTAKRGTFLIHASKKFDDKGYDFLMEVFTKAGKLSQLPSKREFENWQGGIVGYTDIIDCVDHHDSPFFIGPNGFVLKNSGMLDIVKCNGQLGFFTPKIN